MAEASTRNRVQPSSAEGGRGRVIGTADSPSVAGPWRLAWLLVIPAVVAAYLLANVRYPQILSADLNIYLAQPLTWGCVALLALIGWKYGVQARATSRPGLVALALLVAAFQVALTVFAGLLFGFGHSPYARQPAALVGNLFYVGTMLVGVEFARACLIGVIGWRRPLAGLILVSLLFSLLSMPMAGFGGLATPLSAFQLAGETLLPLMAQNLLATLLALLGGPLASIAYRGVIELFEWSSPILPNLPWAITALVGTLGPVIGMLVVQTHVHPPGSAGRRASGWPSAWLVPAFLGAVLVWFNQGLFGVLPTVVSGVSMQPTLRAGDLVLTVEVAPDEIVSGDIIRFRVGESYVLHRVVGTRSEGTLEFITRGDANNVDDPPLPASAVEGRVAWILPGLGWPSIAIRLGLQWVIGQIAP